MLCHRHGERLEAWAAQAETSPVSELRGFAKGLRKDWAAVTAGLTVPYSSGAVEGHVNRIKMIKRQMYGRAKPDLLRKRVLLADTMYRSAVPELQAGQLTCQYASAGRHSQALGEFSRAPFATQSATHIDLATPPVARHAVIDDPLY